MANKSPDEVLRIFADVFRTTPENIRRASGPGARHFKRIRWAVMALLAERYAARPDKHPNDQGCGYAARYFAVDNSTVVDGRKALKRLLAEDPEFARKIALATVRCID